MIKKVWNKYPFTVILLVLSCLFAYNLTTHTSDDKKFLKVTIAKGDSLWKISQQYSDRHSLSNEEFITWVKKHNGIDGNQIFPGEKILIPVSSKPPAPTEYAGAFEKNR